MYENGSPPRIRFNDLPIRLLGGRERAPRVPRSQVAQSGLASVAHGDLADLLPSLEKVRKGDEEQFAAVAKHNEMLEMELEQANAKKNAEGGIQVNEKVALNLDALFAETEKTVDTAHVNTKDSQNMNDSTNADTHGSEKLAETLDASSKSAGHVSEITEENVNIEGTERLSENIN
eukprot:393896_1